MNYTEYTTFTSVIADYDNYATKKTNNGHKPVSVLNYVLGNVQ